MSYYLNSLSNDGLFERLKKEYKEHGQLIVAYDFDDTVCLYNKECPEPTAARPEHAPVCELIRELRPYAILIVWTARSSTRYNKNEVLDTLTEATNWLINHDVPFDLINEEGQVTMGGRKIYCNILLDDRAGLPSAYETMVRFLAWVKGENDDGVQI